MAVFRPAVRWRCGVLLALSLALLAVPPRDVAAAVPVVSEADFAYRLREGGSAALVAFVSPWCLVCKSLQAELARVQATLKAQKPSTVAVAQVDISQNPSLAARYGMQRAPGLLLFADTRAVAPGHHVPFEGQLVHKDILTFVHAARQMAPTLVRQPALFDQVGAIAAESDQLGVFAGFFGSSSDAQGELQDLWGSQCMRERTRLLAFAGERSPEGRAIWDWAGLGQGEEPEETEEAIFFISSSKKGGGGPERKSLVRFSLSSVAVEWRDQLEKFCAWAERQTYGPVVVLDPARAAALDGTFEWLLLTFAPRGVEEATHPTFDEEQELLGNFMAKAREKDARYLELLTVVVPWVDGEGLEAFREFFGVHMVPKRAGATAGECGAAETGWAAVLFNTRTRRRYVSPNSTAWCLGDVDSVRNFVDLALDGELAPAARSQESPAAAAVTSAPSGVAEITGEMFGREVFEPVMSGEVEVLLLVYAPWCSHSINFMPLWHSLAASLAQASAPSAVAALAALMPSFAPWSAGGSQEPSTGRLRLAQLDGSRNEHTELPVLDRYPTLLLLTRAGNATRGKGSAGITAVEYGGSASVASFRSWLADSTAFAPAAEL